MRRSVHAGNRCSKLRSFLEKMQAHKQGSNLVWEEPFRIFFPVGVVIGAAGVALWPLFLLGLVGTYPSISHPRLMTQGFLTCFIFGFLGTAGPRVMSVRHFTAAEILRPLVLLITACGLHLLGKHAIADASFGLALISFTVSLGRRFARRQDSPPPNFALVGLGLVNGIAGTALLVFCEAAGAAPNLYRLGTAFLNIGFILLPVLGVAPFFLRRLLDLPTDQDSETRGKWIRLASLALITGLVIDISLVVEVYTSSPVIGWIRFGVAVIYLAATLPMRGTSILATSLRMSLASLLAGLALWALLPAYRLPALHVVFIGGVNLAIFTVATRVILGHSGNLGMVGRRMAWLVLALVAMLVAMVSRFVADFGPLRNEHLLWGAVSWLIATGLWAAIILPHITRREEDSA